MVADVEKRVEGSLIERLEAQVARLTQELEAGAEGKDQEKFESEFAQQQAVQLESVLISQHANVRVETEGGDCG